MNLPDKPPAYKPTFNLALTITIYAVIMWAVSNYISLKQPSNNIFNGAFAVLLSLAAICFSFSDKIEDEHLSDRLLFAAERLVHGAILVMVASALRYVIIGFFGDSDIETVPIWVSVPIYTGLVLGFFAFFNGMIFAQKGLRILSDLLNDRMFRYKDWDN
ncbi:MAG: hypothetical protein GY928_17375 [Colwellia sp.]|nr:hypothetical protein [Colwellia sp.]